MAYFYYYCIAPTPTLYLVLHYPANIFNNSSSDSPSKLVACPYFRKLSSFSHRLHFQFSVDCCSLTRFCQILWNGDSLRVSLWTFQNFIKYWINDKGVTFAFTLPILSSKISMEDSWNKLTCFRRSIMKLSDDEGFDRVFSLS